MQPKIRITRLSNWLYWASTLLLWLLPAVIAWSLIKSWSSPGWLAGQFPDLPAATRLNPMKSTLVTLIGALSLPPMLLAFAQMRRLFARYRRADIMSDACARHILRAGQAMVALAVVGAVTPTLQMLALTLDNPVGQKVLTIGISGSTLGFLLAGGLLITIGWVMREAAAEIESFV